MPNIRICIDVDDMEKALRFYTDALDLRVGRRFDDAWVELIGASAPIDLLLKDATSLPYPGAEPARNYRRHWTPVHLDFAVDNIEAATRKAEQAGAKLEKAVQQHVYGKLALMSDPFGNGFCLLEFEGQGYDAIKELR